MYYESWVVIYIDRKPVATVKNCWPHADADYWIEETRKFLGDFAFTTFSVEEWWALNGHRRRLPLCGKILNERYQGGLNG